MIIIQFVLGVLLCIWFNLLTILLYLGLMLIIPYSARRKLDDMALLNRKVAIFFIVIQYQLLLWLNSYNTGPCPYVFDNIGFSRLDLSWFEIILLEVTCIVALYLEKGRGKGVEEIKYELSDE